MEASYRVLSAAERAALNGDEVAASNSAAMEEMMSRYVEPSIEIGSDIVPRQTGDVAMPARGSHEFHPVSHQPDNSNLTS